MFIIGNSTVADSSLDQNCQTPKYPITPYSGEQKDDIYFQPEESKAVANLVFKAMGKLQTINLKNTKS
ncbi:MAG: hypothetical protein Q8R96_15780 [Bacteroidota bacterium]|nr:hypothetical protein [Bacteroidota bacterium]